MFFVKVLKDCIDDISAVAIILVRLLFDMFGEETLYCIISAFKALEYYKKVRKPSRKGTALSTITSRITELHKESLSHIQRGLF